MLLCSCAVFTVLTRVCAFGSWRLWTGVTFLSHHTTLCVFPMCVHESLEKGMSGAMHSLQHPGAACVH